MAGNEHLPEEYLYDTRLIQRHLSGGMLTQKDVDAHLQNLPDTESQADGINVEQMTASATARRSKA